MSEMSLYYFCLKTVSHLLIKRRVNEGSRQVNPFQFMPSEILHDLVNTTLQIQKGDVFSAASLKLLLTSGKIREFKINLYNQVREIHCSDDVPIENLYSLAYELKLSLKSLSTACRNLEVLILTYLPPLTFPEAPKFMTEFIRNSPKLKYIHSEIAFDLKALRHCKDLKSVMLHFNPQQSICDFLETEQGRIQSLVSLELLTICYRGYHIENDDLITILQHCPALISFGMLNTAVVLAKLHRTSALPQVNLRSCCWRETYENDSKAEWKSEREWLNEPECIREAEWIRDAMTYNPFVEELDIIVYSKESIANISTLTNLVYLDIDIRIKRDISELFYNGLKVIGPQLKYLSLRAQEVGCPVDVSMSLQNCANLEVLIINFDNFKEFAKPSISLPNLKYLDVYCEEEDEQLWSLFYGCNNLIKLKSKSFDDSIFNGFLNRNSLLNLKAASFILCRMTKLGFKNLFLNAPELEIFEASDLILIEDCYFEEDVRQALLETNHKAIFNDSTLGQLDRWSYLDNNFGIFDEFIFRKKGCDMFNSDLK